jgi:hypothetical protein
LVLLDAILDNALLINLALPPCPAADDTGHLHEGQAGIDGDTLRRPALNPKADDRQPLRLGLLADFLRRRFRLRGLVAMHAAERLVVAEQPIEVIHRGQPRCHDGR